MDGRLRSLSAGTLSFTQTSTSHGETKMQVVVKLIRYHQHGNMVMYIKATRNIVVDYMTQASEMAKPYILEGWHIVHAYIE